MVDRRSAALALCEELLEDIELGRTASPAAVRKASRLARLLDDRTSLQWLQLELQGFSDPETGLMVPGSWEHAARTMRAHYSAEEKGVRYWTESVGSMQATVDAAKAQLAAAADPNVSVSSSNPHQIVSAPAGNARERSTLLKIISDKSKLLESVLSAVHEYVNEKEVELRFGAAAEGAFGQVRAQVDAEVAELVPDAAVKLASAFENASSSNSEDWANAASTCRRLIKAVADALRPPGPDVNGRKMGDDQYINRLVDWIVNSTDVGGTVKSVVTSDLEHLGRRLDAFADAGHKGAHAEVSRYEASRFIAGTYLLIGDILQVRRTSQAAGSD
ncbi:MAG: hypothetical protein PGN07_10310 [Aeromicrobium erythreum]